MELEIPYALAENFHHANGKGIRKIFRGIATVGLAPSRGAFLALMRINPIGLTTRLAAGFVKDPDFTPEAVAAATPKWEKFKKTWIKLGGSASKLEKNIKKGYKRKALQKVNDAFKKLLKKKANFDGNYNATGAEEAATIKLVTDLVLAATPILIPAIKIIKDIKKPLFKKGTSGESVEADIDVEIPTPEITSEITTDPQGNPIDEAGKPIDGDKIFGLPKEGVYVGGVLLTLGIIAFIWKPWKTKIAVPAAK